METKNLAQRLKELRASRGMSQEYLAEESKVSLRTIQRIENNESVPTGETIKRIANALDVQLTELTGSDLVVETNDLKSTIIYLKKQLSKTNVKSEIKTFKNFISILQNLKEKDLASEQIEQIENYIQYLELEKIPSFNNELFKIKLINFKKHLKSKLHFVPNNFYTKWTASFGLSFAVSFVVQNNIDVSIKIGVVLVALMIIVIGILMDNKTKKQERTLNF
ncbi:helix-turn-helix domain-containing protein [Tenacibaculum sp. MEBiC06402]|uniref:helix-turn-helix domain-containing protein n=1 Tax=unclassified Tenacibaculum TaxID=2635139 RepID=UPI003B9978A0